MPRLVSIVLPFCAALCACSGGGGSPPPSGGGNTPTPAAMSGATATPTPAHGATATPVPTATAVASLSPTAVASASPTATPARGPTATPVPVGTSTAYTVNSVPAGLRVTVTNNTSSQSFTTPTTVKPAQTNFVTTITIVPSNNAAAYAVTSDAHVPGSGQILYNQISDTAGSIASVSSSAIALAPQRRTLGSSERIVRVPVQSSARRPAYTDRDLIVRYRDGADTGSLERSFGVPRGRMLAPHVLTSNVRVLDVPRGISIDAFAQRLRTRAEIASVERDAIYYKQSSTAVVPDDTHFNDVMQWDMYDIGAPNAWGYTEGASGVQIAMIDTGIDTTLTDFAGAKLTHEESVLEGTVTQGAAAVRDTDGHGTNTSGIAAAATNNGNGFAGTGYNIGLQIYKVFPDDTAANKYMSGALDSDVSTAIDDAVANGARVINLSLGTCQAHGADTSQESVVEQAIARGVVVVASSGNERSGTSSDGTCANGSSTIDYPAAFPGVISVGATSLTDTAKNVTAGAVEHVASYSNAGPGLTVVAPGGDPSNAEASASGTPDYLHWIFNLYSTTVADPSERCPNDADCKALFAGTSQASPHVSGVAALMLSENPSLTPAQVEQILIATADDLGDPYQGNGRVDAYRALAAVAGDATPPAQPSNINFVAIAYVPNGTSRPNVIDVTYPGGVHVASNGTFRVADVPASASSYKIGVWYDANGDGLVDAGDYFANSQTCSPSAPCASAAGLVAAPVANGFVLN